MKVKANENFKNIRLDVLKVFEPVSRSKDLKTNAYTESLESYKKRRETAKPTAEITKKQYKDLKSGKTVEIHKSIYEKYSHIFEEVK